MALTAFCAAAHAQYVLDVRDPADAAQAVYANHMRQSGSMQNLVMLINRVVKVEREVPVIVAPCGRVNAFYTRSTREVTLCYELLLDSQAKRQREGLNGRELMQSVYSEAVLALLHEVGHHLIHEYELPVLGREEDAADKIAAYILLSTGGEPVLKRGVHFFVTPKPGLLSLPTFRQPDYSDEHGLPQQRLANLVCWGVGKSPAMFADLIGLAKLSNSRLQRCAHEYQMMERDLTSLLGERLQTAQAAPPASRSDSGLQSAVARGEALAAANQCMSCHKPRETAIGPSLWHMAQRYGPDALFAALQRKVSQGARGAWGAVPAPPMSGIEQADVADLALWVASYR